MTDHPDDLDADVELEPNGAAAQEPPADDGPLVFVMETALRDLRSHAAEEPEHEIGGILVGSVTEGERPVVFVESSIRGTNMTSTRGSVTFTHETWNSINTIKDETYPDLKVVGWYHSHPGFGLFLSGHDLFIHRNFFSARWQVAVVTDPMAKTWGCFTWHGEELEQDPDVHTVSVQWQPEETSLGAAASAPLQPAPVIIQADPGAAPGRGVNVALGVLALLLAILLGIALTNYYELRVLRREVSELTRQSGSMAHELTAVRDRVLDMPERPAATTDGSASGAAASPEPAGPIPAPPPSPPPSGAADGGLAP
jgi:proteasome lid subunit RPN8/RPN11